MVSPGKLIYYNGNAAYYSHRSWLRTGPDRTDPDRTAVLPPLRVKLTLESRLDSTTLQDRTACSVCRFVRRNTQKRCTITAGRLTFLSYSPLYAPTHIAIPSARILAARPRDKVGPNRKPVLGSGRDRGNNNVEAKSIYSSSWGYCKNILFHVCAGR